MQFPALPATRKEVLAVRHSFEQRFAEGRVNLLRGPQATEGTVRREMSGHRWLHLATHGFFAPAELRSALAPVAEPAGGDPPGGMRVGLFDRGGVAAFHPGLLSGIALAGANRPVAADQDDGILTAEEIAELDLGEVDLAVLSACETGLGETAGGEGLLGLQRAFQVAGARSVVASLWTVNDDASRKLMVRFYENLWKSGGGVPGRLEALREAQLWMLRETTPARATPSRTAEALREGPERGLTLVDREAEGPGSKRAPPYYWAAFELSGDWR